MFWGQTIKQQLNQVLKKLECTLKNIEYTPHLGLRITRMSGFVNTVQVT